MKKLDIEAIEKAINEIMPGLTMYVRDINLNEQYAKKYVPGRIIREPGFTDASCRVGGMATTHRYAILSNHMADLREIEDHTNWGLFVANRNSHFKVLDNYTYQGKTQILLLHLPDNGKWELFDHVKMSFEEDLIADCRERFENKCLNRPIEELATDTWIDRCHFPIGMSDEGELFENNISIEELMTPVKGASFREFYHKVVYLKCPDLMEKLKKGTAIEDRDCDGVIAYGYIDEQMGLSFHVLGTASVEEDKNFNIRKLSDKERILFLRGSMEPYRYLDYSGAGFSCTQFEDEIKIIKEHYDTKNPAKEEMRTYAFLDPFRHENFPDDVKVILYKEELRPEQVWMTCIDEKENMLYGRLLNEPDQPYGIHEGDKVRILPLKDSDGVLLVSKI